MTLTNGTIHMPLLVKGEEGVERMVEGKWEEGVVTRFILQQYSNQAVHHLAPLAIGKFTSVYSTV